MSGIDEQLRCTGCGSSSLYFGTYDNELYPYDVVVNAGQVDVLPLIGRRRNLREAVPITQSKLIREVVEDFHTVMTDDHYNFVWSCPNCKEYFSSPSPVYKNLCEILRRFLE